MATKPLEFVELTEIMLESTARDDYFDDNKIKLDENGHKIPPCKEFAWINDDKNYEYLGEVNLTTSYNKIGKVTREYLYKKNDYLFVAFRKGKTIPKNSRIFEITKLENYDVRSFNPTDKKIICVFWGNKFCKLAKVGTTSNKITLMLSLQCNDGIYHVDINGQDLDTQLTAGKKNKKRTTKRLSKNKRKKTRKHKKSRR